MSAKTHNCKGLRNEENYIIAYYVDSWQLGVLSDHEDCYGYIYIKYCPFCGEKL